MSKNRLLVETLAKKWGKAQFPGAMWTDEYMAEWWLSVIADALAAEAKNHHAESDYYGSGIEWSARWLVESEGE